MFMRRTKRHPIRRVGNLLWPEIGVRRWLRYLQLKLARLPGTPYSIAAGFACGAAVSMTPFVGLHFVLAALLAWVIGANVVAGLIGTAVGNPWTFPFIWTFVHNLGSWLLAGEPTGAETGSAHLAIMFGDLFQGSLTMDWGAMLRGAWPILGPMLVGSIPVGIVTWLVFYLPLKRLISGYQSRRLKRRLRRKAEQAGFSGMGVPNGS